MQTFNQTEIIESRCGDKKKFKTCPLWKFSQFLTPVNNFEVCPVEPSKANIRRKLFPIPSGEKQVNACKCQCFTHCPSETSNVDSEGPCFVDHSSIPQHFVTEQGAAGDCISQIGLCIGLGAADNHGPCRWEREIKIFTPSAPKFQNGLGSLRDAPHFYVTYNRASPQRSRRKMN